MPCCDASVSGAHAHVSSHHLSVCMCPALSLSQVPVALVTRNTRASVQAFLDLIGPEWSDLFSPVLTREFAFVKPDKRLLLHVAEVRTLTQTRT